MDKTLWTIIQYTLYFLRSRQQIIIKDSTTKSRAGLERFQTPFLHHSSYGALSSLPPQQEYAPQVWDLLPDWHDDGDLKAEGWFFD